jgi:hypothetical protein
MKLKWICLLILSVSALVGPGCVQTQTGKYVAGNPIGRDRIEGRYERTPAELWAAAKDVLTHNGTLTGHDTLLNVMEANIDERKVWVKVEEFDSKISRVIVQARTKSGGADMEMAAFIDKQIAVRLAANNLSPSAPVRR